MLSGCALGCGLALGWGTAGITHPTAELPVGVEDAEPDAIAATTMREERRSCSHAWALEAALVSQDGYGPIHGC